MFCKTCGHEIPADAGFCSNCGTAVFADVTPVQTTPPPLYYGQPYRPEQPPYGQVYSAPRKPSAGWLVFNIVLMVFSAFSNILAIVGVVFGALGQSAYNHGDYKDAESKTRTCKVLGIISLVLFLMAVVFLVLLFLLGGVTSSPYVYSNL